MISTVISYCSLDKRFIEQTIKESAKFSSDLIIVCFDHLLNGQVENLEDIKILSSISENLRILILPFSAEMSGRYHHNLARWVGAKYAKYGWILFLDGDEVPEGTKFSELLLTKSPFDFDAASLECFWYFRSAKNQALATEECGLLVRKSAITYERVFSDSERWAFKYDSSIKFASMLNLEGRPILHHFSWVRTEDEMITKVAGWGHKNDRNWNDAIKHEFSGDFSGVDFVHGYSYREVEAQFNINI